MSDLQSPGSSKECVDLSLIKVSVYQHCEGLLSSIPVWAAVVCCFLLYSFSERAADYEVCKSVQ